MAGNRKSWRVGGGLVDPAGLSEGRAADGVAPAHHDRDLGFAGGGGGNLLSDCPQLGVVYAVLAGFREALTANLEDHAAIGAAWHIFHEVSLRSFRQQIGPRGGGGVKPSRFVGRSRLGSYHVTTSAHNGRNRPKPVSYGPQVNDQADSPSQDATLQAKAADLAQTIAELQAQREALTSKPL